MNSGSITHWIERVKEGSESAAETRLWDRYFSRLAALARRKLADLPPGACDDEDLALSAMNSFFMRAKQGSFPLLHDRSDLWRLLAKITARKSVGQRRKALAEKRGGGQVLDDGVFEQILNEVADDGPTPDMLATINEEYQRLMNALEEGLRPVAHMKLEGYTNREIAAALGRVVRTVERKLDRIRQTWLKDVDGS
jgi:DNA-directed RNA polymerase specialized sigma24 family protein